MMAPLDPSRSERDPPVPAVNTLSSTLTSAFGGTAVAAACLTFGRLQFGGFDHSALIDLGWRLAQGQQPYQDFPCTVPVWFLCGTGHAFQILGVSWLSIVVW